MSKKIIVILTALAIFLVGCSSDKEAGENISDPTGPQHYTNTQHGFKLAYSPEWEVKNEQDEIVAVMLMAKLLDDLDDKFNENVNIIVQNVEVKDLQLDQYTEKNIDDIKSTIDGVLITDKKDLKIGGHPAKMIVFTGNYGDAKLKWAQTYMVKGSYGYIFTFTDTPEDYDNHKKYYEEILNSFELTK